MTPLTLTWRTAALFAIALFVIAATLLAIDAQQRRHHMDTGTDRLVESLCETTPDC